MATEQNLNTGEKGSAGKSWVRILVGLGLLLPVIVCCISVLVVPTVNTVINSTMDKEFGRKEARSVGLDNYDRLFNDKMFLAARGNSRTLTWTRLLVVAIVPLLLALVVNEFGRWVRIPIRLLFTVPLAAFAPTLVALAARLALHSRIGLIGEPILGNPETAQVAVLGVDFLSTFGLAWGVSLVFYLAALRGSGEEVPSWRKIWLPLIASWVIGLLYTAALAPQSFGLGYVLTQGGPLNRTMTLALLQFQMGAQAMKAGVASAVATLVLIGPMVMGLIAGLIVVFGQLRLEMVPWGKRSGLFSGEGKPGWRRVIAILLCAGVLFVSLGTCLMSGVPGLFGLVNSLKDSKEMFEGGAFLFPSSPSFDAYEQLADLVPMGRVWLNTIVPPLIGALVRVMIAYVGALGIGAARPFKKWSELLLLLFSPWLLVTAGPLGITFLLARLDAGVSMDTLWVLISPMLINVPMLFILTLFFKGQSPKWREAQAEGQSSIDAFFRQLILPSLPLVVLLVCFSLLFSMQDLLWPLLVARRPTAHSVPLALLYLTGAGDVSQWPVLMAGIVFFGLPLAVFFFLAFGLIQVLYLDRLALVAGKPDKVADEHLLPEVEPVEAVPLEAKEDKKTARLEPESARETVRLEMEEERKTVRLEPEGAKKPVRLEPEGEPEGERKTVRLEMDEERKTAVLGPEEKSESERKTVRLALEGERKTVRLEMEDVGKTVRLGREVDDET